MRSPTKLSFHKKTPDFDLLIEWWFWVMLNIIRVGFLCSAFMSYNFFWYLNTSLYLANSGIPLFADNLIYQFFMLVPIIVIETYIHKKILKLSIIKAFCISSLTNIISTIVGGFLLLYMGSFMGQIIFGNIVPVNPGSFPFQPLEIIITLIPMFFVSVFLEIFIGSFGLKEIEANKIHQSFLIANAFTYLMLLILAITQIFIALGGRVFRK